MGWNGGHRNGICGVWGELLYLKGCEKFKIFEKNKGVAQCKIILVIL